MLYVNLKLYNWLKNLVDINFLTHFPIGISWYLIEVYVWFEIIAYCSLIMIAFFIFFVWFFIFSNIIKTILFIWLANNMQLALQTIFKVSFITKSYKMPVFWSWISLFYHLRSYFAIVYRLLIYPSFFYILYTCNNV